ncbi:hypothetical protein LMG31506_03002 [Cupriavidus yeoncheonensis]|uniref:Phage baseplate assembly protein V n=1 Tax=Cupriavidus yeoncheonensis TaxID=1462994 RepID=A0A916N450_9BURK|nr:phage baseplate assembly protein V [Cupriavidus yeoncheonensis]CAG2144422.1 hypothetical protein LMG31506_03002 [Cupriavidus yeoncheonensis]
MNGFTLAELERMQACMIRMGTVLAVDVANARVQCDCGGLTTDWLPWATGRAGSTRRWSAPSVGEQVAVFSPYGDTSQGFVLVGFYQDAHPAPAASADKDTTVFPDGSSVEYNSGSNTLTVNVAGAGNVIVNCKQATVNADNGVTLNTPATHCTGALTVDGLLTYGNGISGTGGSNGNAISGNINLTGGDVVADGIGLKAHHHTEHDGPATSAAQA